MRSHGAETEAWKRMVMRSMPRPAWLSEDAPHGDVVLSSRTRVMRNVRGYRFPHRATDSELESVRRSLISAAEPLDLEVYRSLTNAERDYFVGCRLVSPDLPWTLPSRALLVDRARALSLMVNEEDHLRLQALMAGWSPGHAERLANQALNALGAGIEFAHAEPYGFLAASPFNSGPGRRQSAMFHLIGLAQGKRLPAVMKALSAKGIAVRGLFGESSRAIGAFAQVSMLNGNVDEYVGACEYLINEERSARVQVGREVLESRSQQALDYTLSSRSLSLADALRVLGWLRWAASAQVTGVSLTARQVDETLTLLDLRAPATEQNQGQERAQYLRQALGL